LLHRDHAGVFGLNPGKGRLMARKHALGQCQPGLRAGKRCLGQVKASPTSAPHRFRHRHNAARMTGNLLDGGQRPAGKAADFILVPRDEVIAHQKGQNGHRYPVSRFFRTHVVAPQPVL
jgi:hypothetical protein